MNAFSIREVFELAAEWLLAIKKTISKDFNIFDKNN